MSEPHFAEDGTDRQGLRAEQQDEAAGVWVGPGAPAMTHGQVRGAVKGGVVGAVLGALVFLPLGFVPLGGSLTLRLIVWAVVGAVAGAAAGAVYLGGREPELEGETDGTEDVGPG
jgi:hypothetical protein